MTRSLTFAAILLVSAVALPASAQVAAGTLRDPFAQPAPRAAAPTAPAAPREGAEDALRSVIEGAQGDGIDMALFTPTMAAKVADENLAEPIKDWGVVRAVDFVGSERGADLFAVSFDKAETQWIVGLDDTGKIGLLMFREAPPPPGAPSTGSLATASPATAAPAQAPVVVPPAPTTPRS